MAVTVPFGPGVRTWAEVLLALRARVCASVCPLLVSSVRPSVPSPPSCLPSGRWFRLSAFHYLCYVTFTASLEARWRALL
eukprot:3131121-Prymnesium_polylepis.1